MRFIDPEKQTSKFLNTRNTKQKKKNYIWNMLN